MKKSGLKQRTTSNTVYWLLTLLATSVLIALALLFDVTSGLRGGSGWVWPYRKPTGQMMMQLIPTLTTVAIYLAGLQLLKNVGRKWFLGWVFAAAVIMPTVYLNLFGSPLFHLYSRTASLMTTGAHLKSLEFDSLLMLLQDWPNHMVGHEHGHTHVSISPPGWPAAYLIYTKLWDLFPLAADQLDSWMQPLYCDYLPIFELTDSQKASLWLGMLAPLWNALTVLPLFYLGLELNMDAKRVRRAVGWWPLVPAASVFIATLNSPYPFLAVLTVYLLTMGLNRPKFSHPLLFCAGFLCLFTIAVNFSLVPMALLCGLWIAGWCLPAPFSTSYIQKVVGLGLQFAAGAVTFLLLYRLVTGHHLHSLVPLAMGQHLDLDRDYLPWLWLHLWDVILFVGLPIFGLFALSLASGAMTRVRRFSLAVLLTIVIMILSGTARGETGRVWMFFMPLFLFGVVEVLGGNRPKWTPPFLASQLLWYLVIIMIIPAVGISIFPTPNYATIAPPPLTNAPVHTVNANFDNTVWLQSFQGQYEAATNSIVLDFAWADEGPTDTNYLFSILAIDPSGTIQTNAEWLPVNFSYPTTCWGDDFGTLHDQITLPLDGTPLAGDWWFSLSAFSYSAADGIATYLPVTLPDGSTDPQQTGIGPVPISP